MYYCFVVIPVIVDRLGDSKAQVNVYLVIRVSSFFRILVTLIDTTLSLLG